MLLYSSILLIIYITYIYIYQTYFSPLKDVPGPWYLRLHWLPERLMRQTGNFHKYITEYHRQYGPVVRTAPSLVSATSQEAVKSVLSNKKYIKSDFVQKLRDMIGSNILTIQPSDEHLARKKMVLKSIKSMETELNQVIGNFGLDRMSEKWRNKEGSFKVNLIDEFNFLVTDIIGALAFNQSFDCINSEKNELMSLTTKTVWYFAIRNITPWIFKLPIGPLKTLELAHIQLKEIAKRSLEASHNPSNNVSLIQQYKQTSQQIGDELTEEDLISESLILLIGGVDSTASGLSWLFYYLDQYPKVYLKLAYEIRSKKIDLKGLNVNEMKKEYPYLNKVIMESLRLSPPFATSFPRLVPESGLMVDGIYLPPKTQIAINPYPTMRSPQNFSNPDEFKPDRWSEASGTNISEPFIGFSKGTRMCVGKDFALRVLFLATIEIISKFDLHCDYEQEKKDESVCQVTLLPTSGKLELEFQAINA